MNSLLKFKDQDFINETRYNQLDFLPTTDKDYLDFLKDDLGGFYFSKSLHLYGVSTFDFHDIFKVNTLISNEYSALLSEPLFCFGCDLFGNQFCFVKKGVAFFNIESGQFEVIAKDFKDWLKVLFEDVNYFTGEPIIDSWESIMLPLEYDERLVPKKPFIIGGEYSPNNMRADTFFKTITYNSSFARQIFDSPDGTFIDLKIT